MAYILLSSKLFIFGYYCDLCIMLLNKLCDKELKKDKKLNKKLLIKMSNLTNKNLVKWQKIEKEVINLLFQE